jgi:hypothetical protein
MSRSAVNPQRPDPDLGACVCGPTLFDVVVPAYCRCRGGGVYRVIRRSTLIGADRVRFSLSAVSVQPGTRPDREIAQEFDAAIVRDKIALHQAVPTPEDTFEALWQQLRIDLDAQYE